MQNNCNYWRKNLARLRSSHQRCSVIRGVLRNFAKLAGKHLCQSLFFTKVAGLKPMACNFIKIETQTQVFFCEFCKTFKTTFFTEHLRTTASADYMWVKNYDLPNWKQVSQSVAMSWCAVINCNKKKKKKIEKCLISDYPKIQTFIKIHWIHATSCPIDNLPSKILICSDHFEEKCFDPSWKLQNELYYKDRQISRRLIPGSIPTPFSQKKIINLVYLQRREYWDKGKKRYYIVLIKLLQVLRLLLYWKKDICHRFLFIGFLTSKCWWCKKRVSQVDTYLKPSQTSAI